MATKKQTETTMAARDAAPKAKKQRAVKADTPLAAAPAQESAAPAATLATEKPARPKRAKTTTAATATEAAAEPTPKEKPRSWTRPAEETHVAANADVDDTDGEAPAQPPKPKKEKPPKEELVVFAFRLTQAERDAIHATAGPRNATQFVRRVAVAFAHEDESAFQTVLKEAQILRK